MADATPIRDLQRLLREMRPRLNPGVVHFRAHASDAAMPFGAIGWFREAEGETVIIHLRPGSIAGSVEAAWAWITLDVPSAFDAVGLTAAVSAALTAEGIPCNVVAAMRHDHIFVPVARAKDAMVALEKVSRAAREGR